MALARIRRAPLSEREWRRRHHTLLALLVAHLVALPVFGISQGWSLQTVLAADLVIAAFGVVAMVPRLPRDARASACVLGLLTCSATLVMLWHGQIEAHFHYFVIVGAVALYEALLPYAIAFGYVVLQHGIMSAFFPAAVFAHTMPGMDHQGAWGWAAIHGGFVAALAIVNLLSWRAANETRAAELDAKGRALEAAERFEHAFAAAPNGAAMIDADGTMLEVNAALAAAAHTTVDALRGRPWADLLPACDGGEAVAAWPPQTADRTGTERRLLRADGTLGWLLWKHSAMPGDAEHWFSQTVDISDRKHAEEQLAYHATHDGLTQLPNRRRFLQILQAALDSRPSGGEVALVFADVDDFKIVNDSLGHAAGDALLIAVAGRLKGVLGPDDVLGRFGGDEFVVCMRTADAEIANERTAQLSRALTEPFVIVEHERSVTASFGLALASDGDTDASALLRDADAAMYDAKAAGKARFTRFERDMRVTAQRRLGLEDDLRLDVTAGKLDVHYQPQTDLASGALLGKEAFARWTHASGETVGPAEFVPIAEQSGLIRDLTDLVLRRACTDAASWGADGVAVPVSVNVSRRVLGDVDFPIRVAGILRDTGLDADRLVLEIKQHALLHRTPDGPDVLDALRALGVRLAIDNFGTGETSIARLSDLRGLDQLKLDRSLTTGLTDANDARKALVAAVIGVAVSQDVTVIACGIEDAAQRERIAELGCCVGQGYAIARPAPGRSTRRDDGAPVPA